MARIRSRLPRFSLLLLVLLLVGCSTTLNRNTGSVNAPIMRVRLMSAQDQVALVSSAPPVYRTENDRTPRALDLAKNTPAVIELKNHAWLLNGRVFGQGQLELQPAVEGSLAVASTVAGSPLAVPRAYRGHYVFVPTSDSKFDVVNYVDIDGYLAGVLARELLHNWNLETYKAMAIVARTYALYEKASHENRYWDVYPDERSQVYGGLTDESDKSRQAVNDTMGIVVTYSATGKDPRIFKAYFSACCGGITQSVHDVFGEPAIDPLREQNNHATCNASPKFSWGPVVMSKRELTRRFRAWGTSKGASEKNMELITDVGIKTYNPLSRPTEFWVNDAKGLQYTLKSEEFRQACNWDAQNPNAIRDRSVPAPVIYSSFVKVVADRDNVSFLEGHGFGHGVGMCQWCSERRAEEGMRHEDIVITAYPHSKLMRAY